MGPSGCLYLDGDLPVYWPIPRGDLQIERAADPQSWRADAALLADEAAAIRRRDPHQRPIVARMFVPTDPFACTPGGRATMRARATQFLANADVLGLDVYPVWVAKCNVP